MSVKSTVLSLNYDFSVAGACEIDGRPYQPGSTAKINCNEW